MPTEPPPPQPVVALPARLLFFGFVVFLLDSLCAILVNIPLQSLGFYDWYYGPGATDRAGMATRLGLWMTALAFPLWVVGTVAFVRGSRLVTFADVGLTLRNLGRNVAWGVGTAILLAPLVLLLNWGVAALFESVLHFGPKEHPLTAAGQHGLFPAEWALLAFAVTVAAPLREELVFRGVLQRVFAERIWGAHISMGLALLFAVGSTLNNFLTYRDVAYTLSPQPLSASMPVLFILAMIPVYVVVCWWSKPVLSTPRATYPDLEPAAPASETRSQAPAVFATALLFGAVHSFAWPTPIALFVLGLGLGYLTVRTQSLVAAILLHSLFNGVSFVLLLTGWLS